MKLFSVLAAGVFSISSASGLAAEGTVEIKCEAHGATLELVKTDSDYTAYIKGSAAEYILGEQGKPVMAIGGGYDQGRTWEVRKVLQRAVKSAETEEGVLVYIENLSRYDDYFVSGQWRPSLSIKEEGVSLYIPYWEMTGSHSSMQYEYANWYFKGCTYSQAD